eukprot:1080174-Pleurochrysis_carterae.AAC.1
MELARSSLVAASAPIYYWDFAMQHAVDILNRTPTHLGALKHRSKLSPVRNLPSWASCHLAVKLSPSSPS